MIDFTAHKPKVVCILACRVQSTRLYGKPLQFLSVEEKLSILDYMLDHISTISDIHETILAISEGEENMPFIRVAEKRGLQYIIGDQENVLERMIRAGEKTNTDIVFRVTSECPFLYLENITTIIQKHISNKADLTIIEGLPEGAYYELINLSALKRTDKEGGDEYQTAWCSLYINRNPDKFNVQILTAPTELKRPDIRITVDWPEDLIVVRELYKALKKKEKFITIKEIIDYLDSHPTLKAVNGWIDSAEGLGRIWN